MGKITVNEDRCKGCGLCVEVCPKKVIGLLTDKLNAKGYHPMGTIAEGCTGCASCALMCPDCAITVER